MACFSRLRVRLFLHCRLAPRCIHIREAQSNLSLWGRVLSVLFITRIVLLFLRCVRDYFCGCYRYYLELDIRFQWQAYDYCCGMRKISSSHTRISQAPRSLMATGLSYNNRFYISVGPLPTSCLLPASTIQTIAVTCEAIAFP